METASVAAMNCPRILIVEDDEDIRDLCQELLEAEGFVVEACANGQEAIASLDRHQDPCLILLDMMMPIMNGREFMAEFVKRPLAITIAPIPVFLVSATANSDDGKGIGSAAFSKSLLILISCCPSHEPIAGRMKNITLHNEELHGPITDCEKIGPMQREDPATPVNS